MVHRCYRDSAAGSAALAASLAVHRGAGTFGRVAAFLAVSDFVRAKHIEAGFPGDRIRVKPNFAPPIPAGRGRARTSLFLGRLSPEKGLDRLVGVWRDVPARLVVVGDGPERARLQAAAPDTVEFHGAVAPEQVAGYLQEARALVLPSICYEGAPRTVVEALAAGVPVLANRKGALPTIVDDGRRDCLSTLTNPGTGPASHEPCLTTDVASDGGGRPSRVGLGTAPERGIRALEAVYRAVTAPVVPRAGAERLLEGTGGWRP